MYVVCVCVPAAGSPGVFESVQYCTDTGCPGSPSQVSFYPGSARVVGFEWMVVRFVRVIRVPACAHMSRVSRVFPGSPRCLFTGAVL